MTIKRAKTRRFIVGIVLLLFVDVLWVASAGLTENIYNGDYSEKFPKPMFTTYFKTILFSIYLVAFLFWRPWQRACCNGCECDSVDDEATSPLLHNVNCRTAVAAAAGEDNQDEEVDNRPTDSEGKVMEVLTTPNMEEALTMYSLSEPQFEPIKTISDDETRRLTGATTPACTADACVKCHKVKFCRRVEVRHLPDDSTNDSSNVTVNDDPMAPLTVKQTAKLALLFGIVWFFANYLYQTAFMTSSVAVVNTLSSVSGVFVLVLSGIPTCSSAVSNRFTLTKLLVVLTSLGGAAAVGISKSQDHSSDSHGVLEGILCSLGGAFLYACYLVLLKKKAGNEDRLEIPMFFGFVGLLDGLVILPVVGMWHLLGIESFQLPPTNRVWTLLLVNGFIGTVLSELLWLWGCFLTTPLVATLSLSLVTPLSIIYSMMLQHAGFTWLFFVGAAAIVVAFVFVALLENYGSWDPAWIWTKKLALLLWCNQPNDNQPTEGYQTRYLHN